ncbi:MAG: MerR family transcriptional regulator [Ruminococcaceae bacterium]|nr:MerR family transcriptional regulator [Oscillospiraceae bacterium]
MKKVTEVSKLTGISIKTLHHYDKIGLLKPTQVTGAGYRLYDENAIKRLYNILLFKELRFQLKDIKKILDNPKFDPTEALSRQIELLEIQKKHLGELIDFAREIQEKGVSDMNLELKIRNELKNYKDEAFEKWNETAAYQEFKEKNKDKNDNDMVKTAKEMMNIFAEIGSIKDLLPEDESVQREILRLQNFITENYYTCTNEILKGLGQMYTADERFKKNIDNAGGPGTADFVQKAINIYYENNKQA